MSLPHFFLIQSLTAGITEKIGATVVFCLVGADQSHCYSSQSDLASVGACLPVGCVHNSADPNKNIIDRAVVESLKVSTSECQHDINDERACPHGSYAFCAVASSPALLREHA